MTIHVWPVDAVSGAPSYTGRALRETMSPLLAGATSARPLGARSGVRPGTSSTTVAATSTTWTCHPHGGVLDLQAAAEAGPYAYAVNADVTGSVTAANATNPRVDIVYAQISDPAESDGSSVPGVTVSYLAGTAAGTPSPPTAPARSMVLAQINVPLSGGGSPSVTWVAPFLTGAGGKYTFNTTTERDLVAGPEGAECHVLADHRDYEYVNAGWRRRLRVNGDVAAISTDGNGRANVTHGLGITPLTAVVTVADNTAAAGNFLKANVDNFTSTTFRVRVYRTDTGADFASNPVTVYWQAAG